MGLRIWMNSRGLSKRDHAFTCRFSTLMRLVSVRGIQFDLLKYRNNTVGYVRNLIFLANVLFTALTTSNSCQVEMPLEDVSVPKGYWKYDTASAILEIIEWADRHKKTYGKLFAISVQMSGDTTHFFLHETPFGLEMEKIASSPR